MTCSEPEREAEKVDKLFNAFVEARSWQERMLRGSLMKDLENLLRKKTKDLQKQKNCSEVEYVVETVDKPGKAQSASQKPKLATRLRYRFSLKVSTARCFPKIAVPAYTELLSVRGGSYMRCSAR